MRPGQRTRHHLLMACCCFVGAGCTGTAPRGTATSTSATIDEGVVAGMLVDPPGDAALFACAPHARPSVYFPDPEPLAQVFALRAEDGSMVGHRCPAELVELQGQLGLRCGGAVHATRIQHLVPATELLSSCAPGEETGEAAVAVCEAAAPGVRQAFGDLLNLVPDLEDGVECCSSGNGVFEGDIARVRIYLWMVWGIPLTVADLTEALAWHHRDPAGQGEHLRHRLVTQAQLGQNPMITSPDCAESLVQAAIADRTRWTESPRQ